MSICRSRTGRCFRIGASRAGQTTQWAPTAPAPMPSAGGPWRFGASAAGSSWFPYALVTDSANNLYVGNAASDRIEKITPAGVVSTFTYTGLHRGPSGLAFDSTGNLFVAVTGYNSILSLR